MEEQTTTEISINDFHKFAKDSNLDIAKNYVEENNLLNRYTKTVSFVNQCWGHAISSFNQVGSFYKILGHQSFKSVGRISEGDLIVINTLDGNTNMLVVAIEFFNNPSDMFHLYAITFEGDESNLNQDVEESK